MPISASGAEYHFCDECSDRIYVDTDIYSYCDECDTYTCIGCEHGPDDSYGYSDIPSGVQSWDYRPELIFKGNPSLPMFGVELEVGSAHSDRIVRAVHMVDDDESHLYMKEDGSITGVEIVTHPMTLDYSARYPFGPLLSSLAAADCYTNEGYGLHVHVCRSSSNATKASRSAAHQMGWLMFLYRNAEHMQALARRESSRWASFRRPNRGELKRKATQPGTGDDRYVAVNCRNQHTYELRFFQATLSEVEFRAAIELADASVEYTRTVKTADILRGDALRWSHFVSWVTDRSDRYGNLLSEMDTHTKQLPDAPAIVSNGIIATDPLPWINVYSTLGQETQTRNAACQLVGIGGMIERYDSLAVVGPANDDGIHTLCMIGSIFDNPEYLANNYRTIRSIHYNPGEHYTTTGWRAYATAR